MKQSERTVRGMANLHGPRPVLARMAEASGAGRTADVHVRRAGPGDAETLARYVMAVAEESEGRRPDPVVVARGVRESLHAPAHRQYHIAERDRVPVGCCLVTTEWSDWTATWYWWLQTIYVEAPHRGSGVLEAIVGQVESDARREGVRLMRLYVHAENTRARRAYARLGYDEAPYRIYENVLKASGPDHQP